MDVPNGWNDDSIVRPLKPGEYRVWYDQSLKNDPGEGVAFWDGTRWLETRNWPLRFWKNNV